MTDYDAEHKAFLEHAFRRMSDRTVNPPVVYSEDATKLAQELEARAHRCYRKLFWRFCWRAAVQFPIRRALLSRKLLQRIGSLLQLNKFRLKMCLKRPASWGCVTPK